MTDYQTVGKPVARIEGLAKVTASTQYGVDLSLPRMLYARILRSPYAHARVVRVDTTAAASLPGVRAVLTADDSPPVAYNAVYSGLSDKYVKHLVEDQRVFDEVVRYVGEPVAAVAAEDLLTAERALELIEVEYEPLPDVLDVEAALAPGAPQLHPHGPNNLVGRPIVFQMGDLEAGFAQADVVIEDRYTTPRHQGCPMEPHVCLASWDAQGKLTIWTSTQIPFRVRFVLARILGLSEGRLRVIMPQVGGGFGTKQEVGIEPICALLARKAGRPVKLELTRTEEFSCTTTRHAAIMDLRMGAKKDGTLVAMDGRLLLDTGAYVCHGLGVATLASVSFTGIYRCPNLRYEAKVVYTNHPIAGALRGFGQFQVLFPIESHMDMLAEKLGMDPLEIRLKNHIRTGEVDPRTRFVLESCGLDECIQEGARRIGWEEKRSAPKGGTRRRGVGMGCLMDVSGAKPFLPEQSAAILKCNEDGSVALLTGVADSGQGIRTALAQIVAEELGIGVEQVHVTAGDTEITPFDLGNYASRTTYVAGMAVRKAALEVKRGLLEVAAEMLEARQEDLTWEGGRIFPKGTPQGALSVAQVARYAQHTKAVSIMGSASHQPPHNAPAFGAHFAEVEVDTETGRVQVLRVVAANDVGMAINPQDCEGQIEGGVVQGIGFTLGEELLFDEAGHAINPRFSEYAVPGPEGLPEIETVLVESHEPSGPYGAKGVGDIVVSAMAPAIANAIYNATGARIRSLPLTPEKVLQALEGVDRPSRDRVASIENLTEAYPLPHLKMLPNRWSP
ncbi:MAG: molybdopterin-dependent oxidoreductase [Dehalococcoidia bacterium]|nr:molybdopterin-dependent oxidoreductase [Dehalococcoidia bacterium]